MKLLNDVFCYAGKPPTTLVVDYASSTIGGGCFGKGFVQEEQMVAQSTDFVTALYWDKVVDKLP